MTTPHDSISPTELKENHQTELIKARLDAAHQHSYLKDFVYGAIDGAVTTFAVVSGVAGAGLSSSIVVILGVANLIGDGFSMAAGNYLGTRAEAEQREQMRRMEERHVKECPEGEREEIRLIFQEKGFEGELLEQVVDTITADRTRWVETMLREEHGLSLEAPSAMKAATTTFVAFLLIGLLPLIPFLIALIPSIIISSPYLLSTAMTAAAFFFVGAAKSRFVETSWIYAGTETLLVGGLAAGLAYVCGLLLRGIG